LEDSIDSLVLAPARSMKSVLALLFALWSSVAAAQINTGEISGIVRDSVGGVLPGAAVIATHNATGTVVERVTDGEGRFFLPALRIGTWTIEARLTGLAPQRRTIVVEVGRTFTLDFALGVQGLSEQVDVQRTLPLLQITSAEISDLIENREVVQLPLNGRNFLGLAQLSDAVVIPPGGTRGEALQQAGPLPNVGGQRSGYNIYLLDGTKVTDELFNNLVINPSVDSIQEFKIQKSMYPAEFGGKASALINVVHARRREYVQGQCIRVLSRRRVRRAELLQAGGSFRPAAAPRPVRWHPRWSDPPQRVILFRQLRRAADEALADADVLGAGRVGPRG
jgi:Carboxypeptidase regulatory-like domain